ncbi:MAG: BatD family protein [Paludibacteraceae bacterium]|nr:BatD family protein [Paludibacteraceae bacterium]
MKLKNLLILTIALLTSLVAYAADEIKFTASAPQRVIVGQPFQLVFSVNENGKDLHIPEVKGFEIIAGPYTSTSSSTSWVNGKMTSSKEVRYTYTLLPQKEGDYQIQSATIVVNKEKYYSNVVNIKVLPEDKTASSQQGAQQSAQVQQSQSITSDNLFIRPIISRKKVREQEVIQLTYRLYARVDVTNIQAPKFPDFKGFLVQDIELPQNRTMQPEHYDGVNYYTYDLRKVLLFPQQTGQLTIEPMSCDVIVRVRSAQQRPRSFFDDFFDTYQEVSKPIATSKLNIQVEPLPTPRPSDFSGLVGKLALTQKVSVTEVEANQPITITLKLQGSGNLKMLKNPQLQFPQDFEAYEPKAVNNFNTSESGLTGSKTIEYLVIPRHDGDFIIPATTISYFDITTDSYKTLATEPIAIRVNKGESTASNVPVVSNFTGQEKVEVLASDIRYISTAEPHLEVPHRNIVGSLFFWLFYIVSLCITLLLIIIFRKQARDNANVALMRNKKANKVARRRLKVAEQQLKLGNKDAFYDEILKSLWGYLSDKLSIPVSQLNKDNIALRLSQHSVSDEVVVQFMQLLNDCEFERYAPIGNKETAMTNMFESTVKLISTLENTIKR